MNLRIKQYKGTLSILPFILLLICGLSTIFAQYDFYNEDIFPILIQITGFSIITNLVWLFYAILHRFCFYSIVSLITLIVLNIINIVDHFIDFDYYDLYVRILIYLGIFLTTYLIVSEK